LGHEISVGQFMTPYINDVSMTYVYDVCQKWVSFLGVINRKNTRDYRILNYPDVADQFHGRRKRKAV